MDVSEVQYPAKEYLPTNVSLELMDVFGDVPERWVEKFDIVHVRAFGVVITHLDPLPLLENMVKMLSGWFSFFITDWSIVICTLMLRAPHRTRRVSAMGGIRHYDFQSPRPE